MVVVRAGASLDADSVITHCKTQLAGYKVPHHVRFIDALPRTPSGKVEKHKLRAQFAAH